MDNSGIKPLAIKVIESIPFSRFLGLKIESIDEDIAKVSLTARPEFIGNHVQGILHGGVISSVLDTVGGIIVMVNVYQRYVDATPEEQIAKLAKVGTIDMRVDYLRPGRGETFHAEATILRSGNKVAVTRMNFLNNEGEIIACGTGTYLMG